MNAQVGQQALAILIKLSQSPQQIVTAVNTETAGELTTITVETTTFAEIFKNMGIFNGEAPTS